MAAVGGHNKAAHSTTLPLYGCVPLHALSFGEGSKEYCLLSERNLHAKVSVKPKKHSPVISSSASSIDLRASDMERERQDGLSPRGVIEACLTGLESNSDFTRNSTAESEVPRSKAHSNWSRFFKSWKRFSLKHLPSFIPPPVPKEPKRKSRSTRENTVLRNLYNFKSTLQHFTFAELKMATNNFNHENLIGKGGFAEVYKGCLPDGRLVAIKQLTKGTLDEKTAGFLNELGIIAHVDHPNTAKLLGCGIDGGMHLVFELSPLGSLGSALHGLVLICIVF
uniref:Receptor-like cytosolic serine/threonine-protein kinase RBK2 isoform X1 n=1 Tax=Populus alba TaxID=43335 RepID=A0A4U5R1U5_POPAL|nr:receptor-like cytosolic serine/threonine-protein kinase RBK2 isoform X1 [Populus alba]